MDRIVVLVVLTAIAIGVALLLQRRRPDPPSAPSYRAPTQVDRADFDGSGDEPLIVVFTSATCSSCAVAVESATKVAASEKAKAAGVRVQELEVNRDAKLHARYRIDGVPSTLVVDAEGVVHKTFFGPTEPTELEAVLFGAASEDQVEAEPNDGPGNDEATEPNG